LQQQPPPQQPQPQPQPLPQQQPQQSPPPQQQPQQQQEQQQPQPPPQQAQLLPIQFSPSIVAGAEAEAGAGVAGSGSGSTSTQSQPKEPFPLTAPAESKQASFNYNEMESKCIHPSPESAPTAIPQLSHLQQVQQIKLQMHLAQLQQTHLAQLQQTLKEQQHFHEQQQLAMREQQRKQQSQREKEQQFQIKSTKTTDSSSPRTNQREIASRSIVSANPFADPNSTGGLLSQGGLNVLVVEDEPLIRMTAEAFLKHLGHTVSVATTFHEGQERVSRSLHVGAVNAKPSTGFHIIFTDLELGKDQPGGLDFARWIRQEERRVGVRNPTPIIAVTGSTLVEDISGLSGFMVKPYQMESLNRAISMHMNAERQANDTCELPLYRNLASYTVPKDQWDGAGAAKEVKALTMGPFESGLMASDSRMGAQAAVKGEKQPGVKGKVGGSPVPGDNEDPFALALECLLPGEGDPNAPLNQSLSPLDGQMDSSSMQLEDGSLDMYEMEGSGSEGAAGGGTSSRGGSGGGGGGNGGMGRHRGSSAVDSDSDIASNDEGDDESMQFQAGNPQQDTTDVNNKNEAYQKLKKEKHLSILVIEDEPLIRMTAEAFLKHLGHKVQLAVDYAEGQKAMREALEAQRPSTGFHIIFTDLELGKDQPGGLDLARWIRQEERRVGVRNPTPIIAVTGSTLVEDISGLSGFMQKPYQIELLSQAISKWCL
jgi:CheY-like chemotaxis protein